MRINWLVRIILTLLVVGAVYALTTLGQGKSQRKYLYVTVYDDKGKPANLYLDEHLTIPQTNPFSTYKDDKFVVALPKGKYTFQLREVGK
jgi:hypothetical protein